MYGVVYRNGVTGRWRASRMINSRGAVEREESELRAEGWIAYALPYWLCRRLLYGSLALSISHILIWRDNVIPQS